MAEELELNLEENENINRAEERIKNLSSKVKLTAQERDELAAAKADLEQRASSLEKERDFFREFSALSSKFPGASEYQDKILEKVNAGYSPEDAAVSVLNAEGKLMPQAKEVETVPIAPAAGGSASTVIPSGEKTPSDMSQEERRAALQEASDSGELAGIIRNWGR